MNRETYFRAWDTYNEAWADEYLAIAEDGHVIEIKNDGTTEYWKDRFIIEFGTGLKDKNGEEICEGDIVEYTTCHYGNEKRHRKVVEREEWDSDDFGEPHNIGYFNLNEYMTVIGNIHENPELLEQEDAKN